MIIELPVWKNRGAETGEVAAWHVQAATYRRRCRSAYPTLDFRLVTEDALMPTSLPPIQVTVIRSGGEWRLMRDGQDAGHYDYSVDALDAALLRASQLLDQGREVEVFMQDSAGQLRRVDPVMGEVIH